MHTTASLQLPIPSVLQAAAEAWRRWRVAAQRRQDAHDTHRMLRSLDSRTLRDLGFDRSEIGSLAAEIGDLAEPTRVRALQAFHGLRM